jgi:hypothetical protein
MPRPCEPKQWLGARKLHRFRRYHHLHARVEHLLGHPSLDPERQAFAERWKIQLYHVGRDQPGLGTGSIGDLFTNSRSGADALILKKGVALRTKKEPEPKYPPWTASGTASAAVSTSTSMAMSERPTHPAKPCTVCCEPSATAKESALDGGLERMDAQALHHPRPLSQRCRQVTLRDRSLSLLFLGAFRIAVVVRAPRSVWDWRVPLRSYLSSLPKGGDPSAEAHLILRLKAGQCRQISNWGYHKGRGLN